MNHNHGFVPSPEQADILDYELQPLRVVAGAGTGKTTTLAYRMASMMDRHRIEPEQVLGVTFTNKAAYELSQRVGEILVAGEPDPDQVERQVEIFTYHGFAHDLLETYGALAGVERDARIITPAVSRELLRRSVLAADFDFQALDITHLPTVTKALLNLAGECAANLVRPSDLLNGPPGGPAATEDETEAKRSELAAVLLAYEDEKQRLNLLDYGDLLRRAVDLIENHPNIAGRIRERYRCVLLDEYQDTDPAQRRLFSLLFGDAGHGIAVTSVGDPDQCIFEWRGASRFNFEAFADDFRRSDGSPADTRNLSINRRSDRLILDLANRIRGKIKERSPSQDLQPLPEAGAGRVHASWHPDFRAEAQAVAEQARLHNQQGVAWSEMAVLFRKNKDMEAVRLALEANDVPYQMADLGGLLKVPEVVETVAWLRLLSDPEDGPALARLLLGSRFRLGLADLQPLTEWAGEQSKKRGDRNQTTPQIEALDHLDEVEVSEEAARRLEEFRELHDRLLVEAQSASLSELTRAVLTETGAWQEIDSLPGHARLTARLNLYYLLDLTEQWAPLEGRRSLTGFLEHLKILEDTPQEEPDAARISAEEAVTLLTVHRAKGLEWDVVFLPALYKGNFPTQPRALLDPARHHYTLPYESLVDPGPREQIGSEIDEEARKEWGREKHYDQEWRLAYVAATRARKALHLSGACWYELSNSPEPKKRVSKPSELLEMSRDLPGAEIPVWTDPPPERPESLPPPTAERAPDPDLGVTWDEALRRTLDDPSWTERKAEELEVRGSYDKAVEEMNQVLFSLPDPAEPEPKDDTTRASVTALVVYTDCPKRFFWSEVDRLPRKPPGPGLRRGLQLHRRIELFNRGNIPFEEMSENLYDRTPDEEQVTTPAALPEKKRSGWEAFQESPYAQRNPSAVEALFEFRISPEAWIRGRVDAIYPLEGGGWEIVDWKSGGPSASQSALIQLQAYALAAKAGALGHPIPDQLQVSFVYLGAGPQVVTHQVDEPWLAEARTRLEGLMANIRSEQFDPAPSPACQTCDFQKFCPEGQNFLSTNAEPVR